MISYRHFIQIIFSLTVKQEIEENVTFKMEDAVKRGYISQVDLELIKKDEVNYPIWEEAAMGAEDKSVS